MAADEIKPLFTWRSAVCDSQLPPTTRHVLLTLALHMNERGGSCFPSYETLAAETGLNRATVIRQIKVAADAGWLLVTPSKGKVSNRYEAVVPSQTTTVAQRNRRIRRPSQTATVADDRPNRRTESSQPSFSVTPTVAQDDPSTSLSTPESSPGSTPQPGTQLAVLETTAVAPAPARKRNLLFDALINGTLGDAHGMTTREQRAAGTALAEIRKAWQGTDEELLAELPRRCAAYVVMFPNASLTPNAIANQWSRLTERGMRAADPNARKQFARQVQGDPVQARLERLRAARA